MYLKKKRKISPCLPETVILNWQDEDCPEESNAMTLTLYVPAPSVAGDCNDWMILTPTPELSVAVGVVQVTVAVCVPFVATLVIELGHCKVGGAVSIYRIQKH